METNFTYEEFTNLFWIMWKDEQEKNRYTIGEFYFITLNEIHPRVAKSLSKNINPFYNQVPVGLCFDYVHDSWLK